MLLKALVAESSWRLSTLVAFAPEGLCCWNLLDVLDPGNPFFLLLRSWRPLLLETPGSSQLLGPWFFFLYLLEPGLGVGRLGGFHLINCHDELLDSEGIGKQGVLPRLPFLGAAGLELSIPGGGDEGTAVDLAGASDHVLGEVTMAGSADDSDIVLGRLELP